MQVASALKEPLATEILPGIWLGSCQAALSRDFIENKRIKTIAQISPDCPTPWAQVTYYQVYLKDKETCGKKLWKMYAYLTTGLLKGLGRGNLLVACKRGHHRSACVMVAFLCRYFMYTVEEAFSLIQTKRPLALRRTTCMTEGVREYGLSLENSRRLMKKG